MNDPGEQAVDYSFGRVGNTNASHLDAVKAAGYQGILRYVSYEGFPKNITKQEMDYAQSIGLKIGIVWETTVNMMLRGAAGGAADSANANRQLDEMLPIADAVYYAWDTGYTSGNRGVIEDYLDACVGREPGLYGPYQAIEDIIGGGVCRLGWQSAGGSGFGSGSGGSAYSPADGGRGRRLSVHSALYQHFGYVLSNTCDFNDILKSDWGQAGDSTTPQPPEEEDMGKTIMVADPRTGEVFEMDGIFRTYVETTTQMDKLQFLGVPFLGAGDTDIIDSRVLVPFPGTAGAHDPSVVAKLTADEIAKRLSNG